MDLLVSCQFNKSLILGYSAMVQNATNFVVLFDETISSPIQFEGLSPGLYNVVVFHLNHQELGMLGAHVVYTKYVTIPSKSSWSDV